MKQNKTTLAVAFVAAALGTTACMTGGGYGNPGRRVVDQVTRSTATAISRGVAGAITDKVTDMIVGYAPETYRHIGDGVVVGTRESNAGRGGRALVTVFDFATEEICEANGRSIPRTCDYGVPFGAAIQQDARMEEGIDAASTVLPPRSRPANTRPRW